MQENGTGLKKLVLAGTIALAFGLLLQWGLREPNQNERAAYNKKQDLTASQLRQKLEASQARDEAERRKSASKQKKDSSLTQSEQAQELDELTEDFPLALDSLPPDVLEEIAAISKDDPEGGISPEEYEELAEKMRAAGFAGSQVAKMALNTMVDTQIAWERYQNQEQTIELPPQEELNRMKAKMDSWEPSPRQWELLRGTTREPESGSEEP